MADPFRRLQLVDWAILRKLYTGLDWKINCAYTVQELASLCDAPEATVRYRLDRVLFTRGLVNKKSGCPAIYFAVPDEDLKKQIIRAYNRTLEMMENEGWG